MSNVLVFSASKIVPSADAVNAARPNVKTSTSVSKSSPPVAVPSRL